MLNNPTELEPRSISDYQFTCEQLSEGGYQIGCNGNQTNTDFTLRRLTDSEGVRITWLDYTHSTRDKHVRVIGTLNEAFEQQKPILNEILGVLKLLQDHQDNPQEDIYGIYSLPNDLDKMIEEIEMCLAK